MSVLVLCVQKCCDIKTIIIETTIITIYTIYTAYVTMGIPAITWLTVTYSPDGLIAIRDKK